MNHCISAQHQQFFTLMGYHPCQHYGQILDRGLDQRIFGLSITAPPEKLKDNSL